MADCCDCFGFTDQGDSFEFWQGLRGPYFVPHLSADGVLSWTNTGNLPNPAPVDISGPPGPSVELRGPVESTQDLPASASSSELWLVGAASPYDGWFYNGAQWEDAGQIAVGPPGPAGTDGVSPEISVTDIPGGHRVTITDAEHPQGLSFDVLDGEPGQDGVSPDVTITAITGGHRVTITDADHPQGQSFDVMDGSSQGGLPAGGTSGAYLMKTDSADYAAEWTRPAALAPQMDGIAWAGSSSNLSRGDHRHPTDTSRQAKITASGILKGDGSGGVSTAAAGTDYQTPYKTTTLTIETSEWTNNSVSKTVSGMTATALVFVEFSDMTTDYTVAQSTDTLTFTASAAPSAQITVKVGFLV